MTDLMQPLRDFISESLALWKTPGVSVGVIQGDQVLLCEGFGLRDQENQLPVTPNTRFAIGSSSKAFTTFDLGLLVDEGKLDWDKPLRDFLPAFQMHDPVAGERLTPRDIVSHRVGLPRHDTMWYNAPLTRRQIFDRLRYLEPNKDIRQTFQYNNLMYLTAGVLIEQLTGLTWEDFTRQRIFAPIGMVHSNFSVTTSQESDDFALPYHELKNQVERMDFRNVDSVGPAGSINSCAADMLAWLRVHLNQGQLGDSQLISTGSLDQMHSPQTVVPGTPKWKEVLPSCYGLGWFVEAYRGCPLVEHGGNIDGFTALVAMLPGEKIGVVALANMNGTALPTTIAYRVFDLLLGLDPIDWNSRFYQDYLEFKAGQEKSKEKSASDRREGHPPDHTLEEYAGEYRHPGYGDILISIQDGTLQACYNDLIYRVEPYHYEIFEFSHDPQDLHLKGTFATDEQGNVSRLSLPFEVTVPEIVFERAADARLRDRAFLERLAGVYELMGDPWSIALQGDDALSASRPGMPSLELIPYRGTTFQVKGLTGISLTVLLGEDGPAEAFELNQPGLAVLTARRKDRN